jgi:hypothetical protein
MNRSSLFAALLAGATQLFLSAHAAPLDALLSANKPNTPGSAEIEAAYDVVNSTVDIFNIRDKDSDYSGTNVGDYRGAHLRAGVAVTPDIWVDGGFWQRRIDYQRDEASIRTWQLGAQYKWLDALGYRPAMAVRLGAWGNSSGSLEKTSPTRFRGSTLDTVKVDAPEDRQVQLDLIATWALGDNLEVSSFAGAGTSRTKINAVSGTAALAGCNYNIGFSETNFVATLAQPCAGIQRVEGRNSTLGINVYEEAQYSARFLHGGVSGKWRSGPWQLRAGYQYQRLDRGRIDDIVAQRGGKAVKSNHVLVGEVAYRIAGNLSLFGRGQYMTNQFTGEIPFAYNTFTAGRFDKRYGIVSVGVMADF